MVISWIVMFLPDTKLRNLFLSSCRYKQIFHIDCIFMFDVCYIFQALCWKDFDWMLGTSQFRCWPEDEKIVTYLLQTWWCSSQVKVMKYTSLPSFSFIPFFVSLLLLLPNFPSSQSPSFSLPPPFSFPFFLPLPFFHSFVHNNLCKMRLNTYWT